MSFFDELKRRNVFRVGIAYTIGAWILVQVADILLETFGAPEWTMQFIVVLLIIGFPLAVFFAWAFELTPEGVKREAEVDRSQSIAPQTGKKLNNAIIVMLALAVVYLLFDKFTGPRDLGSESNSQAATSSEEPAVDENLTLTPEISRKSIAVLPFQNRSRNEDDAFFVEGVHDDLLTNLARIGSLKVISRTSVMRFKDTELPLPDIARELGVATIMEGAVQRAGDTVRINVQLIDAQTDEHLWAEIFDREMTTENLFAIQSEISQKIAQALKATLSPEEQQRISDRPTENLAAYNAFLRGRQLQGRRNSTDLRQALAEFERAVELDPDFALAWVGVADTKLLLVDYSNLPFLETLAQREAAARKALELNDQLGEAHLSMATVYTDREQYDEADAAYRRAIELSPNYARAYQWYGDFVSRWPARWPESMQLTREAVELDPLSSILQLEVAEKLILTGRFSAAEAQIQRLILADPDFPPAVGMMAWNKGHLGKFDEQIEWTERSLNADPGRISVYEQLAFAYMNLGQPEALDEIRQSIEAIDAQHHTLGWVDLLENVYAQNYPAALETARWLNEQFGSPPSFQGFFGFVHMLNGDYEEALAAKLRGEPRFAERAQWGAAIQQQTNEACEVGWLMVRTGDEAQGMALIEQTLEYLQIELPQYTEHADRFAPDACLLAKGDLDAALSAFESRVAHGHIAFWWIETRLPWNEPLRGTPRFEAAMQQIEARIAGQRARLEQAEAQAGP